MQNRRPVTLWGVKEERNRAVVRGYTKDPNRPSMSMVARAHGISKDRVQSIVERWRLVGRPDPDVY